VYRFPRRSWFCGRFLGWGGNYPDYVTRLFRRGAGTYSERAIHETLVFEGRCGQLATPLLHYTYPTIEHYLAKLNHYSYLNAVQVSRQGEKFRSRKLFTGPLTSFFTRYVLKRGYRDGWQGFVYAALAGVSVFCKYLQLWDIERREIHEKARLESLSS
jgi:hypothetical protein